MKNKNKENSVDNSSTDRKRDLLAEKLIMNELLNAEDFNTLLKTTIEEFERTFCIYTQEDIKEENDIEQI